MRLEKKFLLSTAQSHYFQNRLDALLPRDPHIIKNETYPVFTRYYDTLTGDFYEDKLNGETSQWRFRLRKYTTDFLDKSPMFLECKSKENSIQEKNRQQLPLKPLSFSTFQTLQEICSLPFLPTFPLFPVCHIYYERRAYESPVYGIRVNIDSHLQFSCPDQYTVHQGWSVDRELGMGVVLEVKNHEVELPDFITKELRVLGVDCVKFSKYVSARSSLEEEGFLPEAPYEN